MKSVYKVVRAQKLEFYSESTLVEEMSQKEIDFFVSERSIELQPKVRIQEK